MKAHYRYSSLQAGRHYPKGGWMPSFHVLLCQMVNQGYFKNFEDLAIVAECRMSE